MGYIQSSSTLSVVAYLTQRGRELLLTGSEEDVTTTHFSLGDSDANYYVDFGLDSGFVPDVTGDNSGCTTSVASNVGIKSNAIYIGEIDSLKEVRLLRNDGAWVTNLRVLVHLDKLARYNLFKNIRNTARSNSFIDFQQLSPFADFYQHISVFESKNGVDVGQQDTEIYMNMLFDPKIYTRLSSAWVQGTYGGVLAGTLLSEGLNNTAQTQTQFVGSPLMFAFSSLENPDGGRFGGAGKGGVIVYGREEGYYLTKYDINDSNKTPISGYPQFKSPNDVEGKSFNLEETINTGSGNVTYKTEIIPAVRIRTFDNTGLALTENIYTVTTPINTSTPIANSTFFVGSNEDVTFNNQYTKLFRFAPNNANANGILFDEITNLKEFIRSNTNKDLFKLLDGSTTEYRSVPMKFLVYSDDAEATPALLEITLKYDNTVVLSSDTSYLTVTTANDTNFIQYL